MEPGAHMPQLLYGGCNGNEEPSGICLATKLCVAAC